MNLIVYVLSLVFGIISVVGKRKRWIYWSISLNSTIPIYRKVKMDWNGYSNFSANILSALGFMYSAGLTIFKFFNLEKYFSILLFATSLIIPIWGLLFYCDRRFDKFKYSDEEREKYKMAFLEYKDLDIIFLSLTLAFVLVGVFVH